MSIIVCQCKNSCLIPDDVMNPVLEMLKKTSQKVYCVDDLCALAAGQDDLFQQWSDDDDLTIFACFPRAVKALFSQAKANLPVSAKMINLRTAESPDSIFENLPSNQKNDNDPEIITASDTDWQPWFPIIDYDRCKNCKQCLNFCLFGVYSLEKGAEGSNSSDQVRVFQPNKCKTGCPACARVCPYAAIIFPKYDKTPINGDQVDEAQWGKSHAESAKSLKARLSGGNIYQMLRNRKAEPTAPKSISDLEKLKDQFDIPDDLFESHT